jgi:hypothetical protein
MLPVAGVVNRCHSHRENPIGMNAVDLIFPGFPSGEIRTQMQNAVYRRGIF